MKRKLQQTAKALSASAAVFMLLLLAGGPVQAPPGAGSSLSSAEAGDLLETSIIDETPAANASQRRHRRHSRALLALPYFSFAQGLRRNRS